MKATVQAIKKDKQQEILDMFKETLSNDYLNGHYDDEDFLCKERFSLSPLRSAVFIFAMGYFRYHDIQFIRVCDTIESFLRVVAEELNKK